MAVSLNNLPADAKIGWAGGPTVSAPTDGEILLEDTPGIGFIAGGVCRDVTESAGQGTLDVEGYWKLHHNTSSGRLEICRRGASEMDLFLGGDDIVINAIDWKQDGDATDDIWLNRCFREIEATVVEWFNTDFTGSNNPKHSFTITLPYGVYTIASTVKFPITSANDGGYRYELDFYGAIFKTTGGCPVALYKYDADGGGGSGFDGRGRGFTVVGETDVDNLPDSQKYSNGAGVSRDHIYENSLPEHFAPKFQLLEDEVGLQIGWSGAMGYTYGLDECQFYDLGLGMEQINQFGVQYSNLSFFDCNIGASVRFGMGAADPPEGSDLNVFSTTTRFFSCHYNSTKSNRDTGYGFYIIRVDQVGLYGCSVTSSGDLRAAVMMGLQGDNVKASNQIVGMYAKVDGDLQAYVVSDTGTKNRKLVIEDFYMVNGSKAPILYYKADSGTSRSSCPQIKNCVGSHDYGASPPATAWDSETQYQIGDVVRHPAAVDSPSDVTVNWRYRCIADPGLPGVNAPAQPWHSNARFSSGADPVVADTRWSAGNRVYHGGKVWIATGTQTAVDPISSTMTSVTKGATGLAVFNVANHGLSVGASVLTQGNWDYVGSFQVVEVVSTDAIAVNTTYARSISEFSRRSTGPHTGKLLVRTPFNTLLGVGDTLDLFGSIYAGTGYEILEKPEDTTQWDFVIDADWQVSIVGSGCGTFEPTSYVHSNTLFENVDPLSDPEGIWSEEGNAVWFPESQDVFVAFAPTNDRDTGSGNVSQTRFSGPPVRAWNIIDCTKPLHMNSYTRDNGCITSTHMSGLKPGVGAWEVAKEFSLD